VRMVFADLQPFKWVENYFTDSLLYNEEEEGDDMPIFHVNDGNEADSEYEHLWPLKVHL
jgi:hypothetical protein